MEKPTNYIKYIQQERTNLESELARLVKLFEERTDTIVRSIAIIPMREVSGYSLGYSTIQVDITIGRTDQP